MDKTIDLFTPLKFEVLPQKFPSPFDVVPHDVAQQAAESLKKRLPDLCPEQHDLDEVDGGKMFGVLVVKDASGRTGYLAAYSGMLGGCWNNDGFVPPVFNVAERENLLHGGEKEIAALTARIKQFEGGPVYQNVQVKAEEYKKESDQQLNALIQKQKDRKRHRDTLRQNESIDQQQLEALANQSREDKFALGALKKKLHADGEGVFFQLAQFQSQLNDIKKQRKNLSIKLQKRAFSGYKISRSDGTVKTIGDFFPDGLPPSGAGDCAATKLVQYANNHALVPLALAEFWWGAAPSTAQMSGFRKHGRYYPSCRSRCRKILPFMLEGFSVTVPLHEQPVEFGTEYPRTLHEDEDIVVVEKPAGLLSVPGKVLTDSVEERIKSRYPEVSGVMLLHRLDQATSGVMIAAKNARAYKHLQHQFQDRTVNKLYIAILDGVLEQDHGEINLPLRIDIYDRPRQIVCHERGKQSLTKYSVISRDKKTTRVMFFPHTGRTHQLRVHAAHPDGLDCPILGDELYGRSAERLYLHAAKLTVTHPIKNVRMTFNSDAIF